METARILVDIGDMLDFIENDMHTGVDYVSRLDKVFTSKDRLNIKLLCEEYIIAYDREFPQEED